MTEEGKSFEDQLRAAVSELRREFPQHRFAVIGPGSSIEVVRQEDAGRRAPDWLLITANPERVRDVLDDSS
jgi:hypothetical protein